MAISSGNNVNITKGLASDAASVNDLKQAARKDPNSPDAIRGAAKQFEALFLNMVMKSMRDATPHEGVFDTEQSKMFTSMLDQQMSQSLAQRGVGLADVLTRQLSGGIGKPSPDAIGDDSLALDPAAAAARAAETAKSLPFGMDSLSSRRSAAGAYDGQQAALPINRTLMNNAANQAANQAANRAGAGHSGRRGARPAHVEAFQKELIGAAEEASKTTGIPAKFMMAQAALESGWGKHVMRNQDGSSSNNLFGIKATAGWKGKVVEATTTEYIHGVATRKVEKFRAYDSPADSFRDYASLMRNNPRYEKVLASAQDMNGFAQGLQRAGYATDPRYAEKLTRIIRQS